MPEPREQVASEGRTSMLLCTKAMFLTSSQMEKLCRTERTLMAPAPPSKLAQKSTFDRLFTYIDSPGECSAREAFSLLRLLARRP